MVPIARMLERVEISREDSDTALFYDLLNLGELVLKLIMAGMVSGVRDERERHRYRIEYGLVRASGIGDWATALDDVIRGPASQFLADEARPYQKDLTRQWGPGDDASSGNGEPSPFFWMPLALSSRRPSRGQAEQGAAPKLNSPVCLAQGPEREDMVR